MKSLLVLLCLPLIAPAVDLPKSYHCQRADSDILIDGKLDDDAWENAPWSDPFVDIEGDAKPVPRYRTQVKMLWDDRCLYIAAEMEEPHVWGTILKRDSVIFRDNDFEVFLDPDGDNHEYAELEINALNTQWDLLLPKPYRDNGHPLDCWNIEGLLTAVHVSGTVNDPTDFDKNWTLEIALPWRGLEMCMDHRRPPQAGEFWRINFSRVEWDTRISGNSYVKVPDKAESNWVWSPQGVVDMHRPERWGIVIFEEDSLHADVPADLHWELREAAMTVYYAQRATFEKKERWAKSSKDLTLDLAPELEVRIRRTPMGWNAAIESVTNAQSDLIVPVIHIRDDSYLWFTRRRGESMSDSTASHEATPNRN